MSHECPTPGVEVEARIDRVLTQYRESPNLLHYIRVLLGKIEEAYTSICDLPDHFEIDSATGDQLTLIGKRLGWPRCHCVCEVTPVIGFACEGFDPGMPIVGFCESGTWLACASFGTSDICIDDDEIYRGFLRARMYQTLALYDLESLTTALQAIWGDTAFVLDAAHGRVVMTPGRDLSAIEQAYLKLVPRVMPVALGITQRFHFGDTDYIAGFGQGWFGFCAQIGTDVPLITDDGMLLTTDNDLTLVADLVGIGADMMCQTDVKPYTC